MDKTTKFDDIRPYYDQEVPFVIEELVKDELFKKLVQTYIFPDTNWDDFTKLMRSFRTKKEFQQGIAQTVVLDIVNKTSSGLSTSGIELVDKDKAYLFMSNHRDIVLDASILAVILNSNGYETMEIAIGDNLLIQPWIEDLVRINKSFIVKRGVSFREQLLASIQLSEYIHYAITEKKESVWIAQREGRAKNSDDRTQESVIKMLAMGNKIDLPLSIRELNILPLTISYEYDPCDYLKAKEFQQKRDNPDFKKSPKDDLLNMETGLFGNKGHIHFRFGKTINSDIDKLPKAANKNEEASQIAALIDKEIFKNYKFYPINYIFYDRLWGNNRFSNQYTDEDIITTDKYLQAQLDKIDLPDKDIPFLTGKIMEMYAYPIKNNLSLNE